MRDYNEKNGKQIWKCNRLFGTLEKLLNVENLNEKITLNIKIILNKG